MPGQLLEITIRKNRSNWLTQHAYSASSKYREARSTTGDHFSLFPVRQLHAQSTAHGSESFESVQLVDAIVIAPFAPSTPASDLTSLTESSRFRTCFCSWLDADTPTVSGQAAKTDFNRNEVRLHKPREKPNTGREPGWTSTCTNNDCRASASNMT